MRPVSNEAYLDPVRSRKYTLYNVVVPVEQHWASVTKMCEETYARIDSGIKLIQRGIAMTRRDNDSGFCQESRCLQALIHFWRERYEAD